MLSTRPSLPSIGKVLTLWLLLLLCNFSEISAQPLSQPNIDFEYGDTSEWNFFVGHCCPLVLDTSTAARVMRHEIVATGTDPYGSFPVVSAEGGHYALKLGNNNVGREAERAQYIVHVPAGLSDYSLVFRYAVVFQDPGHNDTDQPRFAVNAWDSATGLAIECSQYLYVASSNLPGFRKSGADSGVLFRDWTTGTVNLSGYGGHSIVVDFTTGDCAWGGHFGYAYIDVSAGLFAISTVNCNSSLAQLRGPYGFAKYLWYTSDFTSLVDTNEIATLPNPPDSATYAVILQPYPGYGCPDTLFTSIYNSKLQVLPQPDQNVCRGAQTTVKGEAENGSGPLSFAWLDLASCGTCGTFTKVVTDPEDMYVRISDSSGCSVTDTIHITTDSCALVFPTAFTPNFDGRNDLFRAIGVGLEYYKNYKLSIYNRWGERVFFTADIFAGWDGIYKDIPADLGTYFFAASYTILGNAISQKGDITLVR